MMRISVVEGEILKNVLSRHVMQTKKAQIAFCSSIVAVLFLIHPIIINTPARCQLLTAAAWGGACQPASRFTLRILAGSSFKVSLLNVHHLSKEALKQGWPEGYRLAAALDYQYGQPFIPTPGLIEYFNPTPYLSMANIAHQSVLSLDSQYVNLWELNRKNFMLHVPEDMAGNTIAIGGYFSLGTESMEFKPTQVVSIISPCDQSDTARVVGSQIFAATDAMDYHRGIALADSMLDCGLSDAAGLHHAKTCALGLRQFDKAIYYLDRLYTDYGVISVDLNTSNLPPLDRHGFRSSDVQTAYENARNGLLRARAAQEQQQK